MKEPNEKPDLHDPQEVADAINRYFLECETSGKRPGNMGLYEALGIDRTIWANAKFGKSRARITPECRDIIAKAVAGIASYREQLAMMDDPPMPVTKILGWIKAYDLRKSCKKRSREGDKQ